MLSVVLRPVGVECGKIRYLLKIGYYEKNELFRFFLDC